MQFSKYSGCGNDFILVDNRSLSFPSHAPIQIEKMCHRRLGIGADGVVLLEPSTRADYRMRIYNSDGSEADMCGNGIRCLMRFIHQLHPHVTQCTIETGAGTMTLMVTPENTVRATVGQPQHIQWNLPISIDHPFHSAHFLNTGVPHLVVFVENVTTVYLPSIAPTLRHHPLFGPNGTNVNIASVTPSLIHFRTWERGVEDETLACGTGAIAVAIAANHCFHANPPVTLQTTSGQHLQISFHSSNDAWSNVTMTGPADHLFDGIYKVS